MSSCFKEGYYIFKNFMIETVNTICLRTMQKNINLIFSLKVRKFGSAFSIFKKVIIHGYCKNDITRGNGQSFQLQFCMHTEDWITLLKPGLNVCSLGWLNFSLRCVRSISPSGS